MAVCKLAVLDYYYRENEGGYSIGDLQDCIGQARENIELRVNHLKYVTVDLDCFIKWAKHKIKEIEANEI